MSDRSAAKRVGRIAETYAANGEKDAHKARRHRDVARGSFFVVSVIVTLGVLWWTGDVALGTLIGVICGSSAAFTFGAVLTAIGRSGDRSSNEHERSRSGHDR